MTTETFTIEDAIAIQREHFLRWSIVLNAKAILMLANEIRKRNKEGYKSPYDVFRGGDIDMFIHNEIMNKL